MYAWASEAHGAAAHAPEPYYATAEFWVSIGLILFFALVAKRAYNLISVKLDERAEKIRERIDEAAKLAEEAQALLATYERKQREAAGEAEAIINNARREADRLAEQAAQDLDHHLKKREQAAVERIAQAEASALAEVRDLAVEVAMGATQKVLSQQLKAPQSKALIDQAIEELPQRLH
jgi:F-type H+-transporting ATPase subunit b